MAHRHYLAYFAGAAITLSLTVALCALLVDPYGIFRPGDGERAVLESSIAQMKLFQAVGRGAQSVVLGNSRADVGFDPRRRPFGSRQEAAHNLAVPGAGLEVSAAQLAALCRIRRVETVVLGVDFMDFIRPRGKFTPYVALAPMRQVPSLGQYARALVSGEAMFDTGRTVLAAWSEAVNRQSPEGLNLMNAYAAEARRIGYYPFFEQKIAEYTKRLATEPQEVMHADEASPRALREILETSRTCGARLVIVTYPYHLQLLALIDVAGLWSAFEDWKRIVTAEIEAAGSTAVFVDVARATSVTSEEIPARGDLAMPSRWYWESGHFKRELGDLVLAAAAGDHAATETLGAIRLTSSNIDRVLAVDRRALENALERAPQLRRTLEDRWRRQTHQP